MITKQQEILVYNTLRSIIREQDDASAGGKSNIETTDTNVSGGEEPFTPAEKRFLGKFDAYGSKHMGIIYSVSDIGIREFIARSGKDFNLTPSILIRLLRDKIIKLVPYTGWGRDDSYTIELQLPLEDIQGYGSEDVKKAEKGSEASGAAPGGGASPTPPLETSGTIRYGNIIAESVKIIKNNILSKKYIVEKKNIKNKTVYVDDSRILKRLPKQFIGHLERIIDMMGSNKHSITEKERIIADILDNLLVNLKLTPKQIQKSYDLHKKQERLKKYLDIK